MKEKEFYRVMVVGPTGAGKSQFCNFVQKDLKNNINKVSDSLNSCTKDPQSNYFTRNHTKYEFIDTAGTADSSNNDIKNLESLINYVKQKESIDYISLLLKFGTRMDNNIRDYLEKLGKIFTATEFYSHLCVFFTNFPANPKKKEKKQKDQLIQEINDILKGIFGIKKDEPITDVKVYFIDTSIDEDENSEDITYDNYDKKSQDTIDIMMEQMKLDVELYGSIDTKNFDFTGEDCKLRREQEKKLIEEFKKKLEEEKLKQEKEEEEKKRLQNEIEQLKENDKERKKKEEDLKIIIERQKEEIQKNESKSKEMIQKKKELEEKAKKKGIEISRLDDNIKYYLKSAKILGEGGIVASSSTLVPFLLFNVTPGSIFEAVIGYGFLGGLGTLALSGIPLAIAAGYWIKKELSK